MSAQSRSIGGSALLLSLLAFVYGALCIYSARQDTIIAKSEVTATGMARFHNSGKKKPDIYESIRCDYTFLVNGVFYSGYGICPSQPDHSVKGAMEELSGILPNPQVTVYYDPANPSKNSLIEFGAKNAYDNRKANLSILVGAMLLLVVGVVYIAGGKKGDQEAPADSEATLAADEKPDSES